MKNKTINILFIILKSRLNKNGKAAIKCRITYKRRRIEFATGFFVEPNNWVNLSQRINPKIKESELVNLQLEQIKHNINEIFYTLKLKNSSFDVEDILRVYRGENSDAERTILEVFEMHNKKLKSLIDVEYSASTHSKFIEAKKHLEGFILHHFKRKDYLLKNLKPKFIDEFEYYLKIEKKHKQITINKTIQRFRKIIKLAIYDGFLSKDPFMLYKPKPVKLEVVFLTPKELKQLENYKFRQARLEQVKNMFVFCCYTGLPYNEMACLKPEHIIKNSDGSIWIFIKRLKTSKPLSIPLLPKAKQLISIDEELEALQNLEDLFNHLPYRNVQVEKFINSEFLVVPGSLLMIIEEVIRSTILSDSLKLVIEIRDVNDELYIQYRSNDRISKGFNEDNLSEIIRAYSIYSEERIMITHEDENKRVLTLPKLQLIS
ncbi:MAG: integrase [Bacteroidetes bacterium]|nr:integrase [Bacteroidota bacterium]